MKLRGASYCLAAAILTGICLWTGFSGYRIRGRQPPQARLFVASVPGFSWPGLHKPAQENALSKPPLKTSEPYAFGTITTDRRPDILFRSSVKPDLVPESISMSPVWRHLARSGQQVIVAGWGTSVPDDLPMVLRIPPYEKLKECMTSNQPCPLDRRLPGWRRMATELRGDFPDKALLRLVERARHVMPEAHVFLKLTCIPQTTLALDNPEHIEYYHFLAQSLMPLMNRLSLEGTTMMLTSEYRSGVSTAGSSSRKSMFMVWGPYIRRTLRPLSATPDDIILTLLYLAGVPIDRHQKGAVLGLLLEDGLLFRRPVDFSTFDVTEKEKPKIPGKAR
jgi:hypothetical protein